jgi:exodeoxyribonuclease VII small subunit
LELKIEMAKKESPKEAQLDFESALKELENIVERMEQGDMSLEQSLKEFEQGINLTRACQTALKEAEQKVQVLVEKNGQTDVQPFENEDES